PRSPHVRFLNRLGGRLLVFVWVGDTVNSKAIVWRWAAACGGWNRCSPRSTQQSMRVTQQGANSDSRR
ncbi:MAG: hypothetical protein ACRDS0_41335, partial [Pseudonocardiaceae bacterium]